MVGGVRRRGVTLIELMITLVLLGIVAGGMMQIIVRQQRFYTGNSGVLDTRSNVRQGVAVLQSSLRGIRPQQDIYSGGMESDHLAFREPRGSSIICAIDGSRTTIVVPPPVLTGGLAGTGLTSWVQPPDLGDSVLVYNTLTKKWIDGAGVGNYISSTTPTEGSGTCTGIVAGTDAARGWSIKLANALPAGVRVGASLRFFRRAEYLLAKASDGDWYLSYFDCNPLRSPKICADTVPVSGPYLSADGNPPGLAITYRDMNGNVTTDPATLRRIDLILRSKSGTIVNMEGRTKDFYRDSLSASVAVRNF